MWKHCRNPYCFKKNSVQELVVVYLSWPVDPGYKKIYKWKKLKYKKKGKKILAGKHCYNQQCYVWGATMLFPHHLQSNIVYKKN